MGHQKKMLHLPFLVLVLSAGLLHCSHGSTPNYLDAGAGEEGRRCQPSPEKPAGAPSPSAGSAHRKPLRSPPESTNRIDAPDSERIRESPIRSESPLRPTLINTTDLQAATTTTPSAGFNMKARKLGHLGSSGISVMDYGAKGDGSSDDTKAFANAWRAACSSAAAVTLLVPAGRSYLLPPATFSGPCKSDVTVMIKGTIVASPNRSAWSKKNRKRWITFDGVKNLKVEGGGSFNGNGQIWWKNSCKINKSLQCTDAPTVSASSMFYLFNLHAVTFASCNNLEVHNLKFKDSQQMHVSFEICSNVQVSNLDISAPETSPNTDGIHVSGTTNIHINNCVIQTGDDCISIVSGSQYVNATNIYCGPGHGISIGSLGERGAQDTVSNVLVDTAQLEGTTNGVRIKTWQGGKGYAKNIIFKNVFMKNVMNPIIIDQNYCDSRKSCSAQKSAVAISGVTYKNITGTSATSVAMEFDCSEHVPCRGIVLQDIHLASAGGHAAESICNNVHVSKLGTVVPTACNS